MNMDHNRTDSKKTATAYTRTLSGTNYEIGFLSGTSLASSPAALSFHTSGFPGFTKEDFCEANALFSRWCPGLNEELSGFADALHVPIERIVFYAMTYLHPNCSQIALPPQMTEEGHPLLARSYEFSDKAEDFTLVKTCVDGKFSHIGTSVMTFGRDEGLNSQGLAVTMSSCGFPVGAMPQMRRPAVTGLQYWAVSRSLLENCRNVEEALLFLQDVPIAYNINMMVADRSGRIALFETLDGRKAVREAEPGRCPFLYATNHACLDELIPFEPMAMIHSLQRYRWIRDTVSASRALNKETLKEMLLSAYPAGLCSHYYSEFFGTTKSLVLDPTQGSVDICWGGRAENGWQMFSLSEPIEDGEMSIELRYENAQEELCAMKPIL